MVALLGLLGPAERLGARPAVADGDRPLDLLGDERVVGHDDDRRAELGVDPAEEPEDVMRGRAVELAGRLVGEEHRGLVGEGDGDRDPLLLAAGQALGAMSGPVGQADQAEQLERPGAPAAGAVEDHRQLHVLDGAQVGQEVPPGLLPDDADDPAAVAGPLAAAHPAEVVAVDDGPPGRRACRGRRGC